MSDRLLRVLTAWRWDLVIRWRASPGRCFIFRDAPDQVVARWAARDAAEPVRDPMLEQTVIQAQGELELRALRRRCGASACTTTLHAPTPSIDRARPCPQETDSGLDGTASSGAGSPAQAAPSVRT